MNGELLEVDEVETPDDDVETGKNSCCGCFNCIVPDAERGETNTGEQTEMINSDDQQDEERLNLEGEEVTKG